MRIVFLTVNFEFAGIGYVVVDGENVVYNIKGN